MYQHLWKFKIQARKYDDILVPFLSWSDYTGVLYVDPRALEWAYTNQVLRAI